MEHARRAARREGPPLRGHGDIVERVAFSPDGRLLASSSDDYSVQLLDVSHVRGS